MYRINRLLKIKGAEMKVSWKNISKVGASIMVIAVFNTVIMEYFEPPILINIGWCGISGGVVGFCAAMKWLID